MIDGNVAHDSTVDLAADLVALQDRPRATPGPPCGVKVALRRLAEKDPALAKALLSAIDNEAVSGSVLAETLSKHGIHAAANSLLRHRRRGKHNGCRCER